MFSLNKVSKKELLALPRAESTAQMNGIECLNFILIPTQRYHESGFRIVEVAMTDKMGMPFALHCEHIDAIVFYSPLSSDCLTKSGMLRFWSDTSKTVKIRGLSTVYVEAVEGKEKQ